MPARLRRSEALVLRTINYAESDRIVTLLTAEYGLQKAFAKGARNSRKRFGSALEPFSLISFVAKEGSGDLWRLQETEILDSHYALRQSIQQLALAAYGAELVALLINEADPQPQVYRLCRSFFSYLADGGEPKVARLLFELRLIYLLGYMPHLLHCSTCLKVFCDENIRFSWPRGGNLCAACAGSQGSPVALGTAGSLARTLNGPVERFCGYRFGETTLKEGHLILAEVLQDVLPREPKSLKFLSLLSTGTT